MAEVDDWTPVGQAAPQDDWQPVAKPKTWQLPDIALVDATRPHIGPIVDAFGQGFKEGFGPEHMGLSDVNVKALQDAGLFRTEKTFEPFKAFNELFIDTLWRTGEVIFRGGSGLFRGTQAAAIEMGVPRDIAAMPEAFFGMPHPTGIPRAAVAGPFEYGRLGEYGLPKGRAAAELVREGEPPIRAPIEPAVKAPPGSTLIGPTGNVYEVPVKLGEKEVGAFQFDISPQILRMRTSLIEEEFRGQGLGTATYEKLIDWAQSTGREFRSNIELSEDAIRAYDALERRGYTVTKNADNSVTVAKEGARIEPQPPPAPDLVQARDLGVIGEERPRLSEGNPKEAAERAAPAARRPDEKITQEVGGDNPWQQRFEQFVSKLTAPEDVKQFIRDAARENNEFLPARQGDISLAHVEAVAEAAGVAPETVNQRGLGRTLRNDAEVRIAMQLMLEATEQVKEAARQVKADASPENLIKMQEAMLRRDLSVEQVVGHRAEWGRTGNVFQEFLRDVKDQQSLSDFLRDKTGRTASDLRDIANGINELDRTQAARVLSDFRHPPPSPFYWLWVNGLISGLLTHTKYVGANALYSVTENAMTTPIAAMIGKAKQLFGADVERVYFGETAAATWGLIGAVPEAIIATSKSIYSGQRAVLKSEIELHRAAKERGEKIPTEIDRAVNQIMGMGKPTEKLFGVVPLNGVWGRIIGAPGDMAMGIHTFFKILGERASLGARAYREAMKEGLSPTEAEFWQRRSEHLENPSEAMLTEARADAYKGTFMGELGPHGRRWQEFTKKTPGLKWLFPFSHIPVNLMKATIEHTPLAFLDAEMRADITGKNGGVAQDKAIARMVVGSAVMGYFVNAALNGRMNGDLPRDPKERDSWKLQGRQPNSMLIGNTWVSLGKFGPAGNLANFAANLAHVIPHLQGHDDEGMSKATVHLAHAVARIIIDEVGMLSLKNLFEAAHDDKKGAAWAANTVGSFVPFSSLVGQTASGGLPFTGGFLGDPYMRETKSFIDGIKYRIPFARETLLPKRDWTGQPVANPQYGNILRQKAVNVDLVDLEMDRLGIHPAAPVNRIGGIQLPPKLYDEHQVRTGAYVRTALENWVTRPEWSSLPAFAREEIFRNTIKAAHEAATATMQAAYPQIIQQGVDNRIRHITGQKQVKKLPELTAP